MSSVLSKKIKKDNRCSNRHIIFVAHWALLGFIWIVKDLFINRELSWLEFNKRVLEEASDASLPLLERVRFLAITASNLDEFFMIRVGGLRSMVKTGHRARDMSGMTPGQQLSAIRTEVQQFYNAQYDLLNESLLPAMDAEGIVSQEMRTLSPVDRQYLSDYFDEFVAPVLTPLAVDLEDSKVTLQGLQVTVICELKDLAELSGEKSDTRFAIVSLPPILPRFIRLPRASGFAFVALEDLVAAMLHRLFPNDQVISTGVFRFARNGDIAVDEDDGEGLAEAMEDVLAARRESDAVRVTIPLGTPRKLVTAIMELCKAKAAEIYRTPGWLDLSALHAIADIPDFDHLKFEPWESQRCADYDAGESIFDVLDRQDLLLHHPYESFDPVLQLLREAAEDPNVLAIKQILYRTAKNSQVISELIRAAENGKQVTAVVELKARFDEQRNLERAEELQRAGVQLVYGVRGLKSHAKICLIVRNHGGRLQRYCHFGTGNYNESTARLYTDVSFLTSKPDYGADASSFFNAVTGRSRLLSFARLVAAPHSMRERLLELIDSETERARQGQKASIVAKINSLQDRAIIEALYKASQAGVSIRLNVRGICCLRPGVKKLSENIEVVSIIDRFLEHSRIYYFHQGGSPKVYIGSADWMTRSFDKRIELMTSIGEGAARQKLVQLLEGFFDDNVKARVLQSDGSYQRRLSDKPKKTRRVQEFFYQQAVKASKKQRMKRAEGFEPHVK